MLDDLRVRISQFVAQPHKIRVAAEDVPGIPASLVVYSKLEYLQDDGEL